MSVPGSDRSQAGDSLPHRRKPRNFRNYPGSARARNRRAIGPRRLPAIRSCRRSPGPADTPTGARERRKERCNGRARAGRRL